MGMVEQPERRLSEDSKGEKMVTGSGSWWRVILLLSVLLAFYVGAETGFGGFLLVCEFFLPEGAIAHPAFNLSSPPFAPTSMLSSPFLLPSSCESVTDT